MKDEIRTYEDLPLTLTVDDVANVLGLSKSNAYKICRSKEFPAKRVGKKLLIPRDSFIKWIHDEE